MAQSSQELGSLLETPLLGLLLNGTAALVAAALISLLVKTLARTVGFFAWIKANREIAKTAALLARMQQRDSTRVLIAITAQQFSIYIILSLLLIAAAIVCLATHGGRYGGWFFICVTLIALLFQKTHEHYARASALLQLRTPDIEAVEARVRSFYLAMTAEQKALLETRLTELRQNFLADTTASASDVTGLPRPIEVR